LNPAVKRILLLQYHKIVIKFKFLVLIYHKIEIFKKTMQILFRGLLWRKGRTWMGSAGSL